MFVITCAQSSYNTSCVDMCSLLQLHTLPYVMTLFVYCLAVNIITFLVTYKMYHDTIHAQCGQICLSQ